MQKLIKTKKKTIFEEKLKANVGKPKELWKALKSLGLPSKKTTSTNICLKDKTEITFDSSSISEIFKSFYSNLASNLVKQLPPPKNMFDLKSVEKYYSSFNFSENKLSFERVSPESVLKTLKNLDTNKASGIDNISRKFLNDGAKILAAPISQICNLFISRSTFPDACKIAKLKPLFKKGSKNDPKNFRPISLLPLISKAIERITDQTMEFLSNNKILYKFQSGFRKNHSTDFCLSYLTDNISSGFEKGLMTGMILIDLQKAFDTIDHEILI